MLGLGTHDAFRVLDFTTGLLAFMLAFALVGRIRPGAGVAVLLAISAVALLAAADVLSLHARMAAQLVAHFDTAEILGVPPLRLAKLGACGMLFLTSSTLIVLAAATDRAGAVPAARLLLWMSALAAAALACELGGALAAGAKPGLRWAEEISELVLTTLAIRGVLPRRAPAERAARSARQTAVALRS
jgi:hypothetical protein